MSLCYNTGAAYALQDTSCVTLTSLTLFSSHLKVGIVLVLDLGLRHETPIKESAWHTIVAI